MSTRTSPFDQLPDEIILKIIGYLQRQKSFIIPTSALNRTLCSFILCNKRFWRIGLPAVYYAINIFDRRGLDTLIRTLGHSPNYIDLVKELELDWRCFAEYEVDRLALRTLGEKGQLAPHVLIQSLMELEKLDIKSGNWPTTPTAHTMPYSLVHAFHVWLCQLMHAQKISPKLKSFTIHYYGSLDYFDAQLLIPAFLYPSVTTVTGYHTEGNAPISQKPDWLVPQGTTLESWYRSSNVETLQLYDSRVDGISLTKLLQLPRCLKKFTYEDLEFEDFFLLCSKDTFLRALSHVADTLEVLNIRWRWEDIFEISKEIWAFGNFTSLRKLAINYSLLFGGIPQAKRIPAISHLLPRSLEILGLYLALDGKWTNEDYLEHVKRIILGKSVDNVPCLRMVVHMDDPPVLRPLIDLAATYSITIIMEPLNL
jgi:hypothetical protein